MLEAREAIVGSMDNEQDPTLLKVNGSRGKDNDKEYVKKLANALIQTFNKHKVARLRCVGAAAINNADKAILVASEELAKKSIKIVEAKSWVKVFFRDSQTGELVEKSGILKEIIEFPTKS